MGSGGRKSQVLRLKRLLEILRSAVARRFFAGDDKQSTEKVSEVLGADPKYVHRFWSEKRTGGPALIEAIRRKIGEDSVSAEILELLEGLPDREKSLVRYSSGAIDLFFEVVEDFERASSQPGRKTREQMVGRQFARFFGEHEKFVLDLVSRNIRVLEFYSEDKAAAIRSVLKAHDWDTVSPIPPKGTPVLTKRGSEIKGLVGEIRPYFESEWAMCKAVGVHQESLSNAIAGRARQKVSDAVLRKAQKLLSGLKAKKSVGVVPEKTTPRIQPPEDSQTFVGSFVSSLNSSVRMGEASGIGPDDFTDGHRDQIIRILGKLTTLVGIDTNTVRRLKSTQGISAGASGLDAVFSALKGGK